MFGNLKVALSILLFALPALAQKNELAIQVGGYLPVQSSVGAKTSFVVGESYSHRLVEVPLASVYFEAPAFAVFKSTTDIVQTTQGHVSYSALFFTPGAKLKLAPGLPISPYLVGGGGVAYYSFFNSGKNSTTTGVFDFGGGVDFKFAPFLSTRLEARDFYAGNPNITSNFTGREHQVIATIGLVLRF